jgi:hypothetical protein
MKTLFSILLIGMSVTTFGLAYGQEPAKPKKSTLAKKPTQKVAKTTKKAKEQPLKQ